MTEQAQRNYHRIAEAIGHIRQNFRQQPSLEELAEKVHMSPFHFQRMFTEWAGVSPKKFLQYVSLAHAKQVLKAKEATLFDAVTETGLSGTSRLHDLFVKIEGMTPGEFKNGGEHLRINYSFGHSPFGQILVAATPKGVCYMAFAEDEQVAFAALQQQFPRARFSPRPMFSSRTPCRFSAMTGASCPR
ncbi:AraC family transcriptional regulator [Rufibacter ruber]|uniref:AraC family transcriptional regulator n=1 Tax=Rufibacter ruber TaxID=1783499 RepID=UPI000B30236A